MTFYILQLLKSANAQENRYNRVIRNDLLFKLEFLKCWKKRKRGDIHIKKNRDLWNKRKQIKNKSKYMYF